MCIRDSTRNWILYMVLRCFLHSLFCEYLVEAMLSMWQSGMDFILTINLAFTTGPNSCLVALRSSQSPLRLGLWGLSCKNIFSKGLRISVKYRGDSTPLHRLNFLKSFKEEQLPRIDSRIRAFDPWHLQTHLSLLINFYSSFHMCTLMMIGLTKWNP